MKISKDIQRTARRLFLLCFDGSRLDESRFRDLIHKIVSEKPRHYLALLTSLKQLLILELDRHRVNVTSAEPLADAEKENIKQRIFSLHGDDLDFEWHTDPAVIAGLRIQIADTVYDGTILNRLQRLQSLS